MVCKKCLSKPYENQMCRSCFQKNFEGKLRKEIRDLDLRKGTKIFLEKTNDTSYSILSHLISEMKYVFRLSKTKSENSTVITPWSADQEIAEFLDEFSKEKFKREKKIRIPKTVTIQEITAYAQIKKLKLGKTKFKNKKQELINEELQKLDNKYKGIKKGSVKSIIGFEKFLK